MSMKSTAPTMFFMLILLFIFLSQNKPSIDQLEQKAIYQVLDSLNSNIPWSTLYPNDLCRSPPPGVVCDDDDDRDHQHRKAHIVELNFGYVSDQTQTPPCSHNATLNPLLFTSFTYLRKLSFYKCFNNTQNPIHLPSLPSFPISLEELFFIENPAIVSPLQPFLTNLTTSLKRLVISGNGFYGELLPHIGDFLHLEELTISRSNIFGQLPASLGMLNKLEILDLSHNEFQGCVPEHLGNLISLLKLNLSFNEFGSRSEAWTRVVAKSSAQAQSDTAAGFLLFWYRLFWKGQCSGSIVPRFGVILRKDWFVCRCIVVRTQHVGAHSFQPQLGISLKSVSAWLRAEVLVMVRIDVLVIGVSVVASLGSRYFCILV
ncbi:hypothetical protein TSUD_29010 [Trifolium subterraneum]|uniref:Leucine-rich repeat-containing N-terminal plant-type domain-containing protein n=1 Tax=Trifolium subterraneum TaxID=3900 RepID=A0A2Z6PIV0_TRISU|nr:hypothetical protein TSUD_29010 [Trifolium subterraneum]